MANLGPNSSLVPIGDFFGKKRFTFAYPLCPTKLYFKKLIRADHVIQGCIILDQTIGKNVPFAPKDDFFVKLDWSYHFLSCYALSCFKDFYKFARNSCYFGPYWTPIIQIPQNRFFQNTNFTFLDLLCLIILQCFQKILRADHYI